MRLKIYVSPVDVDDADYSNADHLCYDNGDIEGVVQCSQTMRGQFLIIEPDTENGASGQMIFGEIYAWSYQSLAHTLTEATPQTVGMTLNSGDYSNLFGTSMNGSGNCIRFAHSPNADIAELLITLPEN